MYNLEDYTFKNIVGLKFNFGFSDIHTLNTHGILGVYLHFRNVSKCLFIEKYNLQELLTKVNKHINRLGDLGRDYLGIISIEDMYNLESTLDINAEIYEECFHIQNIVVEGNNGVEYKEELPIIVEFKVLETEDGFLDLDYGENAELLKRINDMNKGGRITSKLLNSVIENEQPLYQEFLDKKATAKQKKLKEEIFLAEFCSDI